MERLSGPFVHSEYSSTDSDWLQRSIGGLRNYYSDKFVAPSNPTPKQKGTGKAVVAPAPKKEAPKVVVQPPLNKKKEPKVQYKKEPEKKEELYVKKEVLKKEMAGSPKPTTPETV